METTQIYDILLTLLNNSNKQLFKALGVRKIYTGKKKLLSLDVAGVRDLYEAIIPTPKPRKIKGTPSAEAIRLGFIGFENKFEPDSNPCFRKDVFWWWSLRF